MFKIETKLSFSLFFAGVNAITVPRKGPPFKKIIFVPTFRNLLQKTPMKKQAPFKVLQNNLRNIGKSIVTDQNFRPFVILAAIILLKLFWFQGTLLSFEDYASPSRAINRFLAKASIALFISAFLFISKKGWWSILILLALDVWMIGNIIYYRASGFFINADALQMADNLHGFWSSILIYFSWKEFIPVLITILYAVFILKSCKANRQRNFRFFIATILLAILARGIVNYSNHKTVIRQNFIKGSAAEAVRAILDPQYDAYRAARIYFTHGTFEDWEKDYINKYSIADYFLADVSYYFSKEHFAKKLQEIKYEVPIASSDKELVDGLIKEENCAPTPQTNLVVILFESLEGWIFENYEGAENIAPNMKRLIGNEHTLFAPRVKSQTKQGNSGDGQMIALTGILPLSTGAACRLYGQNSYPNYAHLFSSSATINIAPGSWNQKEINPNYGIKQLREFQGDDQQMIDSLIAFGDSAKAPFFLLGITIASHSPFKCGDLEKTPKLSKDMPSTLQNYLTCINYTDRAFEKLFAKIESDSLWKNTTLVIMGDHTIFKEQMIDGFSEYANKANISLKNKKNYVPLIIHSPTIPSKIEKDGIYYQADVYPTILDVIGDSFYYWKGLGKSILSGDSTARLDEETGYRISDVLIRNNYFEKFSEFNK